MNSTSRKVWWNEPIGMAVIGVLSILAVLIFRYVFLTLPSTALSIDSTAVNAVRDDIAELRRQQKTIAERVSEIERSVKQIQEHQSEVDAASHIDVPADPSPTIEPLPAPATDTSVQERLRRGWAYIGRGKFDVTAHADVLSALVAAYEVKGLSSERNSSLRSTIHQVNEIGVQHVIAEARALPRSEAELRLRAYLEGTPRLTPGQKQRVDAALAN